MRSFKCPKCEHSSQKMNLSTDQTKLHLGCTWCKYTWDEPTSDTIANEMEEISFSDTTVSDRPFRITEEHYGNASTVTIILTSLVGGLAQTVLTADTPTPAELLKYRSYLTNIRLVVGNALDKLRESPILQRIEKTE